MADFKSVLKKQRESNKGLAASVGNAAMMLLAEKIDPRNILFKRNSLLSAFFPKVKGYQADSTQIKSTTTEKKESSIGGDSTELISRLDLVAKNTMVLPIIMRDMNVVRQGIVKLVKLQGGQQRNKADMFFQRSAEREKEYEMLFGSRSKKLESSPSKQIKDGSGGGFLSGLLGSGLGAIVSGLVAGLLKGGLLVGLMMGLGKYFTDPDFRSAVNSAVNGFMSKLFGDNWLTELVVGLVSLTAGVAALKGALAVFQAFVISMVAKLARQLGLPVPTVPDVDKDGKPKGAPQKRKTPTKGSKPTFGKRRALAGILTAMGLGYLVTKYLDDEETEESDDQQETVYSAPDSFASPETPSMADTSAEPAPPTTTPEKKDVVGAVASTAADVAVATAAAMAINKLGPKAPTPETKSPLKIDERGQFRRGGKFASVEDEKLEKVLKKMQEWFKKSSKKKGFYSTIKKYVIAKFGISIAARLGVFIASILAAGTGVGSLITVALMAYNVYTIYQLYDWLFGEENAAQKIDDELDAAEKGSSPTRAESDVQQETLYSAPDSFASPETPSMADTSVTSAPPPMQQDVVAPPSGPQGAAVRPGATANAGTGSTMVDAIRSVRNTLGKAAAGDYGVSTWGLDSAGTQKPTRTFTMPAASQSTSPTKDVPTISDSNNDLSEDLVNYIKQKENPSLLKNKGESKAFWDYKQYSVGYGTKAKSSDEVITEEEADKRLREELLKSQKAVLNHAKKYNYNFNQNQVNALSSFVYNLGPGILNQLTGNGTRSVEEISKKMLEYNKVTVNGNLVEAKGLTNRRNEEFAMFTSKQPPAPVAAAPDQDVTDSAENPILASLSGEQKQMMPTLISALYNKDMAGTGTEGLEKLFGGNKLFQETTKSIETFLKPTIDAAKERATALQRNGVVSGQTLNTASSEIAAAMAKQEPIIIAPQADNRRQDSISGRAPPPVAHNQNSRGVANAYDAELVNNMLMRNVV
jgi:GH24 family phage-related lysozyme (muramidase)